MPEALKNVLGALLAFLKEVWTAVGFEEGVTAIDDILAKFAA